MRRFLILAFSMAFTLFVITVLVARVNARAAIALLMLWLTAGLILGLWWLLRPIGEAVTYQLKPPDERDLIDFDAALREREARK